MLGIVLSIGLTRTCSVLTAPPVLQKMPQAGQGWNSNPGGLTPANALPLHEAALGVTLSPVLRQEGSSLASPIRKPGPSLLANGDTCTGSPDPTGKPDDKDPVKHCTTALH